jgi:hypothetical protein
VEHGFVSAIEQVTGCRVEPCFITQNAFDEQMGRMSFASNYQEIVLDEFRLPEQMAKAVAGFAVEINAREAGLAEFRNYVWARLTGKRGRIDVIFCARNSAQPQWAGNSLHFEESIRSLG